MSGSNNKHKSKSSPGEKLATGFAMVLRQRRLLFGAGLAIAAIVACRVAWNSWGGAVARHPHYAVTADSVIITPQPDWIQADVKADVVRDASLSQINLLDPQATVKIAHAFSLHTWVGQVRRVSKQPPSRVLVEIEYRRPVAMVEVTDNGQPGLVPVDGSGIVLPPSEFTSRTRDYLRVQVGETVPGGPVGTSWGDERVHGAAAIANTLLNDWRKLDLHRISLPADSQLSKNPNEHLFELHTKDKVRIVWGRTPGRERTNECSAAEKVARLIRYVEKNGSFPANGSDFDVRDKAGLSKIPKTARQVREGAGDNY